MNYYKLPESKEYYHKPQHLRLQIKLGPWRFCFILHNKTLKLLPHFAELSVAGMQKLVAGSAELSKRAEFKAVSNLQSIDVISVRLWFDRKIHFKYPANVLAGFESQAGSTFFDLNTLQVSYF